MYPIMEHFQMRKVSVRFIKNLTSKDFFDLKEKESQEVQEKLNMPFYFCFKENKNFQWWLLCKLYNVESHKGIRIFRENPIKWQFNSELHFLHSYFLTDVSWVWVLEENETPFQIFRTSKSTWETIIKINIL